MAVRLREKIRVNRGGFSKRKTRAQDEAARPRLSPGVRGEFPLDLKRGRISHRGTENVEAESNWSLPKSLRSLCLCGKILSPNTPSTPPHRPGRPAHKSCHPPSSLRSSTGGFVQTPGSWLLAHPVNLSGPSRTDTHPASL